MSNNIFASEDEFRATYLHHLKMLLKDEGNELGSFILVCANAYYDPTILDALENELQGRYEKLIKKYKDLFAHGYTVNVNEEDLLVFLKLAIVGLEALQATEQRDLDHWQVQFNHLRAFRPRRMAQVTIQSIRSPFEERAFNFKKPFLAKECFWEGTLNKYVTSLFYNKYPFAQLHALLVPDKHKGLPQILDEAYHTWAWNVAQGMEIPGFAIGYNSLGAFASVNHLHFQMFIESKGLPVMRGYWKHNGGDKIYPISCQIFDSPIESWKWIDQIQQQDTEAYNLLYVPGKVYSFKRKRQNTYEQAPWTSGFAWREMSGSIITFNKNDYETLQAAWIEKEFYQLSA